MKFVSFMLICVIFSASDCAGQLHFDSMENIRQCTCSEEIQCTNEMKSQAMNCLEPCWDKFGAVTKNPEKLKNCFTKERNFMDFFLNCFEENLQGCSEKFTNRQIPKINLANYFQRAVLRFNNTRNLLVDSLEPIRRILNSSKSFAKCVNKCFLNQNVDGFCFDKKNCQPLITDFNAQRALRKCTRKMNWKQEAGNICDCVVDSGLTGLKAYCPIFKLMAKNNRRQH